MSSRTYLQSRSLRHVNPVCLLSVAGATVALGAFLTPALAAVTPPTAAGVLTGTIVDWPGGTTGTLHLSISSGADLASAPIDATGHFLLQLPGPTAFSDKLANIANLFTERSNYASAEYTCKGQGSATPNTGHFQYFVLNASVGDQPLQALKLTTDPRLPRPVGSVTSSLMYLDVSTTLNGAITCRDGTDTYQGTFPAGWSLPKITVMEGTKVAFSNQKLSQDPLPATIAWRLRDQYAGIGIGLNDPPSGVVGFIIDPVVPGRPAALAGVQAGDLLVEINGQDITSLSLDAALTLLRGGPSGAAIGSKVILGVKRGTNSVPLHFTLVRTFLN